MRSKVKELGNGIYVAKYNGHNSVAVEFARDGKKARDASSYVNGRYSNRDLVGDYFRRGEDDKQLLDMHQITTQSPNKWQLVETRAAFVAGGGLRLFKKELDANGDEKFIPELKDKLWQPWYDKLELSDYWEAAPLQVAFSAELNVKIVLDSQTKKVASLSVIDNNDIRAERPKTGGKKIETFWLSDEFGYVSNVLKSNCDPLPAFDYKNPTKHIVSVVHLISRKPGQKIYGWANWWGTKEWTEVANEVPKFYKAAFRNGFFVTHHVTLPDNYGVTNDIENDPEAIKEVQKGIIDNITDTLSSVEEANKIVFTFSKLNSESKLMEEIKITPVPNPINDEAFLKMVEAANQLQASGHGVPAKLAGVQLGSDMGSSGKEIAAEAAYMQDFLTVFDRETICKPIRIAASIDKLWQDKHIGIKRINSYVPGSTSKNDKSHPQNS